MSNRVHTAIRALALAIVSIAPADAGGRRLGPNRGGSRGVIGSLMFATFVGLATPVSSQSIVGQVVDAESGRPVAGALVEAYGRDDRGTGTTGEGGQFRILLREGGEYLLRVSHFGYASRDSLRVRIDGRTREVQVEVELSVRPLPLEGLTVLARGMDLRHRATLEGFRARHETALDVGRARVLDRNDPEIATAFDIGDVMKWLPTHGVRCIVYFVDGVLSPGWTDAALVSTRGIEGIEFYHNSSDAPLEMRGGGAPCFRSASFSVMAIWRTRIRGG